MGPTPTIRRLMREVAELSSSSANPTPAFHAAPVSDADLHEWHFTLVGPPSPSPYAGGIYHGRITLPPTYPLKPPNFRFLTPSGRFETNREICLSISGFHEETWMPAWGVRTALTALRSFMAEQGTAGQVGGLEARDDVRKRLASESRSWKCDGCGQKTNERIMKEWWETCREAGVKVDEEDMGLEVLPEGMSVEARDPNTQNKSNPKPEAAISPTASKSESQTSTPSSPQLPAHNSTQNLLSASQTSIHLSPTPSPEAIQAAAEAVLTPSELASTRSSTQRPTMGMGGVHAPPLAAAIASAQQEQQRRRQHTDDPTQLITIDRAIATVFVALCLMLLKKMFYPAAPSPGMDDFYLQRA